MKRLLLFISGFLVAAGCSWSQQLSVDDMLSFSSLTSKKFDTYISKKGFKPFGRDFRNDTIVNNWQQFTKGRDTTQSAVVRRLSRYQNGNDFSFCLQTSSREEYLSALIELKEQGFVYGNLTGKADTSLLFQKANYTVQTSSFMEDSLLYYSMVFRRQSMPDPKDVIYGNDLLQFDSHEYLASFFGRSNVRSDLYYFSEKEITKCSVLYPNSARQAVFIWEDLQNLRGLSQVIISGNLPTEGSADFTEQMRENRWLLNDGLRFNMRLDELVQLNGEDISFFGTNSPCPLMVLPRHKGDIDLSNTTVILDCLNCGGASLLDQKVISAFDALNNSLRLYIGMIVLTPPETGSPQTIANSRPIKPQSSGFEVQNTVIESTGSNFK